MSDYLEKAMTDNDPKAYKKRVIVRFMNNINPKKGPERLGWTLSQFQLSPGYDCEWEKPVPEQGEQVNYAQNESIHSAICEVYPSGVKGYMDWITVNTYGKIRLEFTYDLEEMLFTINGSSTAVWVDGFLIKAITEVTPSGDFECKAEVTQWKPNN
jgi:hypothetical protein